MPRLRTICISGLRTLQLNADWVVRVRKPTWRRRATSPEWHCEIFGMSSVKTSGLWQTKISFFLVFSQFLLDLFIYNRYASHGILGSAAWLVSNLCIPKGGSWPDCECHETGHSGYFVKGHAIARFQTTTGTKPSDKSQCICDSQLSKWISWNQRLYFTVHQMNLREMVVVGNLGTSWCTDVHGITKPSVPVCCWIGFCVEPDFGHTRMSLPAISSAGWHLLCVLFYVANQWIS